MTHRRSFSQLFREGVRQYRQTLITTLPLAGLYAALPSLLLGLAAYLSTLGLWRDLASRLRELLSLGELDWESFSFAAGSAFGSFFGNVFGVTSFGGVTDEGALALLTTGVLLLMIAFMAVCSLVLVPLLDVRLQVIASASWHGRRMGLRQAFASANGQRWRAIVAMLCQQVLAQLGGSVLGAGLSLLFMPLIMIGFLSASGFWVVFLLYGAVVVLGSALGLVCLIAYYASLQKGLEEGRWGFVAMWKGIVTIRKRLGAMVGGFALLYLGIQLLTLLFFAIDACALLFLSAFTPFGLLVSSALHPLMHFFFVMVYFDQRVETDGYNPYSNETKEDDEQ